MDSTMPARSALTVTPRTATTLPIALRLAGHSSCRATVVVTASGGGWKEAAMAMPAWIWRNLTVPMPPRKTATANSITIIRLVIELHSPGRRSGSAAALVGRVSRERFGDAWYRHRRFSHEL
jgi:hypothetical protein